MTDPTQRRALVVRGGWDGHQPVETTDSFLPFLAEHDYDVRVEDETTVYADAAYMAGVDVVVQTVTMSAIADDELRGLTAAVRAGTGLAGWHGGIADSFRSSSDYLHLVGGQFATHPAKAPREELPGDGTDCFVRHTIDIVPERADHPIVAGLSDFELTTEQYWVLTDEYNDVLATTTLAAPDHEPWHRPVTCPAVWTRQWGEGRVFVSTPGHRLDVVNDPNVRTIISRGILWASR
ncbi:MULTISPECIES: ThuA domain-containing protein [unclassified Isoptericola]|uniref:ThuA domain-containing protein n=1 Tax=unclassified Isoptericola TaxID=2623355 RepID=UPI00364D77D3